MVEENDYLNPTLKTSVGLAMVVETKSVGKRLTGPHSLESSKNGQELLLEENDHLTTNGQ